MSLPRNTIPSQAPVRDPLSREVLLTNVRRALFGGDAATTLVGPYQVKRRLGGGAMGSIFESYDPRLKRPVALKLVDADTLSAAAVSVMTREARALARIDHPNVVTVFDAGQCQLGVWVGMELLVGQNLEEWMKRPQHRPVALTLRTLREVGHALTAVHAAGLVHRDVKPANVFLCDSGVVKLIDFGLALADTEATAPRSRGTATHSKTLDHRKTVSGTPAYMAPEQHRSERATPLSDQYAWCVMAWEALYGERPFFAVELDALYRRKVGSRLSATPLRVGVPARVHSAVLRGLSPDPADRWPAMEDLLTQCSIAPPRRWRAYLAAGAGAALLLGWSVASAPADAACPGAGAWDPDAREGVRVALVGGGSDFRRETWARVEPRLDTHVVAYEQLRGETCRSLRSGAIDAHVADDRFDCLARWKASFDNLTSTLAAVDEDGVAGTIGWTLRLDSPAGCVDTTKQEASRKPPPPRELREPVAEIRRRLQVAGAMADTSQFADVLPLLADLKRDAAELQFPPLTAEVQYLAATTFGGLGRRQDAEAGFIDAYHTAQLAGHGYMEAATAVGMIDLALRRGDFDTARLWVRHGQAGGHTPWPEFEVTFLTYEAMVLSARGRADDALKTSLRAVELAEPLEPTTRKFSALYAAVGKLLDVGRVDEAHVLAKRGVDEHQLAFGPQHPTLAPGLGYLALAAWAAGDVDASISTFERVTALRRTHRGDPQRRGEQAAALAIDLMNFAGKLATLERWEEAAAKLDEAVPILEDMFPQAHPALAVTALAQGNAAWGLQDYEAALGHFERARVIAEEASGVDDDLVGWALVGNGISLLELGSSRAEEAHAALERGWRLLEPSTQAAEARPTGEVSIAPFALAKATWALGGSRQSVIQLVEEAQELARGSHPVAVSMTTKINTWRLEHAAPSPP